MKLLNLIYYYIYIMADISNKSSENDQIVFDAERILTRYPDRIPIIVNKQEGGDVPEIDKKKYLVPKDLTLGQFIYIIRKRIKLEPEQALFLFVNGKIYPNSEPLSVIYNSNKNEDKFLYITYSGENTFGF